MSWLGKTSILGRESEKVETPEEFYIRAKDPVLVEYLNYIKQVAESEEL